ncbi:hypothetical protein CDV31_011682 [Fusarium ambrosium]|uniref:Uncharacterized protein n=1 Tax=Fusarium ambrosium TaxID=131363 RepID=A0A428TFF3_9HYPO|nr:hypothetical protein CDV31_011682 [Fusarium ambrosium]
MRPRPFSHGRHRRVTGLPMALKPGSCTTHFSLDITYLSACLGIGLTVLNVGLPINLRSSSVSAVTMTMHFHGSLPGGITVHYSRGRTAYHFEAGSFAHMSIMGEDIHITPMGGGRRGSGGRNRGRGNNRQRRQRRRGTERAPNRAENKLQPPGQPNPSVRTAKSSTASERTENPAEKANTSNLPMGMANPSLPMKNTQDSQAAKNTQWGLTEERPTGTANFETSRSTGLATGIESFAKTVETSRHAQPSHAIYPNEFGRAGGRLATGPWDFSSGFVQSLPSFPAGPG